MDESGRQDAFVSELKHWRDVRGHSQTRLAKLMGFDRSYVSKIETGGERAPASFAKRADAVLNTGGALLRAWRESEASQADSSDSRPSPAADETDLAASLVVIHDHARLTYDGRTYTATQRRQLLNGGTEPVTQYLVRIAVDRYPESPGRSNEHYRRNPLTWQELDLRATHDDLDPMVWTVRHDRDAFKEVWLLFENEHGRFPLYPGESTVIEYTYNVSDTKWGRWYQRAVRVPTRRLSVELDFPTDLGPRVWGTQTTLTASAVALPTAVMKSESAGRSVFSWSTEEPPLHARYRMEWSLCARPGEEEKATVNESPNPSEVMTALGVVQEGDTALREVARPFDLPAEAPGAEAVLEELKAALQRIGAAHQFSKGMGLSAPQIGISRAAAIVRMPEGDEVMLLNPRVIGESPQMDEQYEGCMSFFDVRGEVPRPLMIEVEHQTLDGSRQITVFERGHARLVAHEIDHLNGIMYRDRMRPGVEPIPVSEYKGTGRTWRY